MLLALLACQCEGAGRYSRDWPSRHTARQRECLPLARFILVRLDDVVIEALVPIDVFLLGGDVPIVGRVVAGGFGCGLVVALVAGFFSTFFLVIQFLGGEPGVLLLDLTRILANRVVELDQRVVEISLAEAQLMCTTGSEA